jgi:hypothetical protein
VKEDEAVAAALDALPRNDAGDVDIKALIDEVARLIDFDELAERRNKATRAVRRRRQPGSSEPDGQLALPGTEAYAYEPDRLVADNEGHVIEQAKARPHHKAAEAERAREVSRRQLLWSDRKTSESALYSAWAIEQLGRGRPAADITFDVFVRETGIWSDQQAEPEVGPMDEAA